MIRGRFRGRGLRGGRLSPTPLRNSNLCRPKGSPLCTIFQYPFLVVDPKNFLKASLASKYTSFRGERAPKKRDFLVKFFQKSLKKPFLGCFFKILPAAPKFWPKQGQNSALGELENSI